MVEESPFHLKGSFPGPDETPYEGGHFEVVRYHEIDAFDVQLTQLRPRRIL